MQIVDLLKSRYFSNCARRQCIPFARCYGQFSTCFDFELSKRFLITLALVFFVFLVESIVPIPGIDQNGFKSNYYLLSSGPGVVDFQRCLSAHVFMLGISPFIMSSFVISIGVEISEINDWFKTIMIKIPIVGSAIHEVLVAKDEGKVGEARIKRAVRKFGIPCMLLEAFNLTQNLSKHIIPGARLDWPNHNLFSFKTYTIVTLMAGSCIIEKFACDISQRGLGDGPLIMSCLEPLSQFYCSIVCIWTSILKGSIVINYKSYLTPIAFSILLSSALWLNEARDVINLEYSKQKNSEMTQLIRGQSKPYLPLKWLPKGIYPISMATLVLIKIPTALIKTSGLNSFNYFFAMHPISSVLFGFTAFMIQNVLNVGVNHKSICKQMTNVSARIPQVRPGSESLAEIKKRNRMAKYKGGVAIAFYAAFARLLDIWVFREIGIQLSTTSIFLIACILAQCMRQIKAQRATSTLKQG